MVDVASDGGWLGTALTIVNLIQSVMQVHGTVPGAVHDAEHDADRNSAGRNVIHGVVCVAGMRNTRAWRYTMCSTRGCGAHRSMQYSMHRPSAGRHFLTECVCAQVSFVMRPFYPISYINNLHFAAICAVQPLTLLAPPLQIHAGPVGGRQQPVHTSTLQRRAGGGAAEKLRLQLPSSAHGICKPGGSFETQGDGCD